MIEPIEKIKSIEGVHIKIENQRFLEYPQIETALSIQSALLLASKINEVIDIANAIIQELNITIEQKILPTLQLSEDQIKAIDEIYERHIKNRKGVEAYEG